VRGGERERKEKGRKRERGKRARDNYKRNR